MTPSSTFNAWMWLLLGSFPTVDGGMGYVKVSSFFVGTCGIRKKIQVPVKLLDAKLTYHETYDTEFLSSFLPMSKMLSELSN